MHFKQNRKRNKVKRKENKTIQKLQRKHWDEHGNEIKDDNEPTEIVVTQYVLTDDTNRNFNALLSFVFIINYFCEFAFIMVCTCLIYYNNIQRVINSRKHQRENHKE